MLKSNTSVQNQGQITKLSSKIFDLQQEIREKGYKSDHPKFDRINNEIRALQEQIRYLESTEVAGVETDSRRPNPDRMELEEKISDAERELEGLRVQEADLSLRLQDHKDHTLEVQDVYMQITTLEARVARIDIQLETNTAAQAKQQADYQWMLGPGGDPFEVLAEIEMPQTPSKPNPALIISFSLFLGLGIGLGLATVTEFGKAVFRSVADVGRVMVVPVLGTINVIQTKRELRRQRLGQILAGGLTFGLISILSYVTWAWKMNPQLLSSAVYDAIEEFRSNFE